MISGSGVSQGVGCGLSRCSEDDGGDWRLGRMVGSRVRHGIGWKLDQVARTTRYREPLKPVPPVPDPKVAEKEHETDLPTNTESAYILTSLDADTS